MAYSETFKTPICRFSYVQGMFNRVEKKDDLGNPVLDKNGRPVTEQQCTLIFDKNIDMSPFNKAMADAIVAQWGEKALERAKNGLIRSPILAGDGKEARIKKGEKAGEIHEGLGADKFFIRVASRQSVPVRFRQQEVPAEYGTGADQIKSGDFGFAVLHAYTWSNSKNGDGVSFGIDYLQKTRAGESLGGGGNNVDVSSVFEAIPDEGNVAAEATKGGGAGDLFG